MHVMNDIESVKVSDSMCLARGGQDCEEWEKVKDNA